MAVELDIFVGNTTIMDEEVYQLWLDGYTGRGVHNIGGVTISSQQSEMQKNSIK